MDHRTYGDTRNCKGCRYWSEMLAHGNSAGVQAMCLAPGSEHRGKYTSHWVTCAAWASGFDGAIDEPGSDPQRYEKLDQEAA